MIPYMPLIIAGLLGAIIGSFLNVVILRTHTKRSLGGFSHCMSCGVRLEAVDLIPILSYLALFGRCRRCGARISPRYALIEATTALLFVAVVALSLPIVTTVLTLLFLSLLLVVFVYDLEHLIIPDEYVVGLVVLALFLVSFESGVFELMSWQNVLSAGASFAFLGGLWKVSDGRWIGLGDAKLSIPLALVVGLSSVFSLIVFAFWIGAGVALTILLLQRLLERGQRYLRFLGRPLTMKAEVPFAPFLILSYVLVHYTGADAFALTHTAMLWCARMF